MMIEHLSCPACGEPAIPASGWSRMLHAPTWSEDDAADCPGCGAHLRADLQGDDEPGDDDGHEPRGHMVAVEIDR